MRSAGLREPQSITGLAPNSSVYYDFDTIIEDIPEPDQNRLLKSNAKDVLSPHFESERGGIGIGTTAHSNKSPGQYSDNELILERNVVKSRCCRVRRDSEDASTSCNMF